MLRRQRRERIEERRARCAQCPRTRGGLLRSHAGTSLHVLAENPDGVSLDSARDPLEANERGDVDADQPVPERGEPIIEEPVSRGLDLAHDARVSARDRGDREPHAPHGGRRAEPLKPQVEARPSLVGRSQYLEERAHAPSTNARTSTNARNRRSPQVTARPSTRARPHSASIPLASREKRSSPCLHAVSSVHRTASMKDHLPLT